METVQAEDRVPMEHDLQETQDLQNLEPEEQAMDPAGERDQNREVAETNTICSEVAAEDILSGAEAAEGTVEKENQALIGEPEKGMSSGSPSSPSIPTDHISVNVILASTSSQEQDFIHVDELKHSKLCPNVESIVEALPTLDINCESQWPPLAISVPRTPCPYNLRSMGGNPEGPGFLGGLGPNLAQNYAKNKRGRKSHMSKAKLKAKLDVADGKQHSIQGVLRAAHPLEGVIK